MQISHEVPVCLLDESRQFNCYDYCLVHLLKEIPEYHNFFKDSLAMGRKVILDNSLFELGTIFDSDKFAEAVLELRPTEYIIPDAFNDIEPTVKSSEDWIEKYDDLPGIKIGVIQGSTLEQLQDCYQAIEPLVDKVAISFFYQYYQNFIPVDLGFDPLQNAMFGRHFLIKSLVDNNIINHKKEHHLLGCALPQEGRFYKHQKWITSMDTSNPVMAAINNIRYPDGGIFVKPSTKMADIMTTIKRVDINDDILDNNLTKFRQMWAQE